MSYGIETRERALTLRQQGYSINEIAQTLKIARSTSSLWVSSAPLNKEAKLRLKGRGSLGRYRSILTKKAKRGLATKEREYRSSQSLEEINFDENLFKLLCSIFFWTEGGKHTDSYVYFTNSDPVMVQTFLKLLRRAFRLDESKLRGLIHIHEYHNDENIRKYWSDLTKIPLKQFTKSYLKSSTKKRTREAYMGCISLRYYDAKIAQELRAIYNVFARQIIGS